MRYRTAYLVFALVAVGALLVFLMVRSDEDPHAHKTPSGPQPGNQPSSPVREVHRVPGRTTIVDPLRPKPDDPTTPTAKLVCIDIHDAPVSGARVFVGSSNNQDERFTALDPSGSDGEVIVPPNFQDQPVRILVRHPQHALLDVPNITVQPDEPRLLTLQPGATIDGEVVLGANSQPLNNRDVIVTAVAATEDPDAVDLLYARQNHPARFVVTTNEHGRFKIAGLTPGSSYRLIASGQGYASRAWATAEAGQRDVRLPVSRLCAAILRLRSKSAAAPLPTARIIPSSNYLMIRGLRAFRADLIDAASAQVVLSGAHPHPIKTRGVRTTGYFDVSHWHDLPPGDDRFYSWYFLRDDEHQIGPLHVTVHIPGFERASAAIYATPVGDVVSSHVLALTPKTKRFGTLNITFTNGSSIANERKPNHGSPIGKVVLANDDIGEFYEMAVWSLPKNTITLSPVPCGRYRAVFETSVGNYRYPAHDHKTIVSEDAPGEFTVAIKGFGAIVITDESGDPLQRQQLAARNIAILRVTIGSDTKLIERGPYLIHGIPAGSYGIKITGFSNNYEDGYKILDEGTVTVTAAKTTKVKVQLP